MGVPGLSKSGWVGVLSWKGVMGRKEAGSLPFAGVVGIGAVVLRDGVAGSAFGGLRVNTASLFFGSRSTLLLVPA